MGTPKEARCSRSDNLLVMRTVYREKTGVTLNICRIVQRLSLSFSCFLMIATSKNTGIAIQICDFTAFIELP